MSLNNTPGLGKSGTSRMEARRSMYNSRCGIVIAYHGQTGSGTDLANPERQRRGGPHTPSLTVGVRPEKPMSLTIRRATPADEAVLVEFNTALAWETEHKRLRPDVLTAGVRAVFADAARGFYTLAQNER